MRCPGKIIWLDSIDSTNSAARRMLGEMENLDVVAAKEQTSGRGQGDHVWISAPGENLTFSVLLRFSPLLHIDNVQKINDFICGAIVELLEREGLEGIWIKKPNDIWVGDRKIAGILIENILEGRAVRESIVGVGIDVNQDSWPAELPNPVSMSEITGKKYNCRKLLDSLAVIFASHFERNF